MIPLALIHVKRKNTEKLRLKLSSSWPIVQKKKKKEKKKISISAFLLLPTAEQF